MAYNLRTGLLGSGDVDINVSLSDLDAANITSGQFGDARLSDMNAAKLSGLVTSNQIQNLQGSQIVGAASIPTSVLPGLSTSQITSGTAFPVSFIPALSSLNGQITSSQLSLVASDIPTIAKTQVSDSDTWDLADLPSITSDKITSLAATKLTGNISSGNLDLQPSDIPNLSADKITSGTFAKFKISTASTWALADIPSLPATKITSGIFTADRIPDLSALKITSDTLDTARIPNLDASKITSGTIASARLPATSDILAYKAVTAEVGGTSSNTITNSYEVIDSNTKISLGVPSSGLFEVELSFYADGVNADNLLARLVVPDTVNELASYYSAITTPSTEGTYMVSKSNSNSFATYFTAKWVIQFPATAQYINANVNIDAQVKTASFGQSVNVRWGRTNSYVGFSPVILKATALPSSSVHVHSAGQ